MHASLTAEVMEITGEIFRRLFTIGAWVIGLPLAFGFLCYAVAAPLGAFQAWYDCANDRYIVRVDGRFANGLEYKALLKLRHNITLSNGSFLASDVYWSAYSAVSRPAIIRHFGRDIFADCRKAARGIPPEQGQRLYWKARGRYRDAYDYSLSDPGETVENGAFDAAFIVSGL
ncbi:MAG: hypothetical protein ACAI35_05705 [Candidatus Methylacidiphilales bacterium]|nr:hypothetical protein [Candidatus Methylacidiphilales bacterium]